MGGIHPFVPRCRLPAGYWPSYNVPFHKKIYTLSGYGKMWERYGEDFSYDLCPRAKIFRRDQAAVQDLQSLKHIMRSNGACGCARTRVRDATLAVVDIWFFWTSMSSD